MSAVAAENAAAAAALADANKVLKKVTFESRSEW